MRAVLLAALLAVSGVQVPAGQAPQKPNFIGTWANVRPDTEPEGFIPAIQIFEQAGQLKVQAWGKCVPQNCQWPAVRFWQLRDMTGKTADRGFAEFPDDNKNVAMRLDGDQLVAEIYELSDTKINETKTRAQFATMRYARK